LKGRIATTPGLALSTRPHRETDRICSIYTLDFGKVPVRFVGVNRPAAKLRSLAEPLVHGEYRLHAREGSEFATATGGSLVTTFPELRSGLGGLLRGLEVCELLDRLTPFWNPVPEEYRLAVDCLGAMSSLAAGASPPSNVSSSLSSSFSWCISAFGLRLLKAAGFGVHARKVSEPNRLLWDLLHTAAFPDILALPPDPHLQRRLELFVRRSVERLTQQPLRCAQVADTLAG